jgi:putative transcriptional regulator
MDLNFSITLFVIIMHLQDKVTEIIEEYDYDYFNYSGCFDILARKDEIFLLKLLGNIDSFQQEQAKNLKVVSKNLEAHPFLVGEKTRREFLEDNILYERFNIPAVTPNTLENILQSRLPKVSRMRGGLFVNINPQKLKEKREKAGLSQSELARKVGITKKSIFEHEHKEMKADYEIVKIIERFIGDVSDAANTSLGSVEKGKPKDNFEKSVALYLKKMGFDINFVSQTPFNIIAKKELTIFSEAENSRKIIEKNTVYMKEFSDITEKPVLVITKEEINAEIPSLKEKELKELHSSKDIRKFLRKW